MRLIDADALLVDGFAKFVFGDWTNDEETILRVAVNEAPTVDAVPVVRCKDCMYKEITQPGMVYCPNMVGGWVDEEWFCAGGERGDDGRPY